MSYLELIDLNLVEIPKKPLQAQSHSGCIHLERDTRRINDHNFITHCIMALNSGFYWYMKE